MAFRDASTNLPRNVLHFQISNCSDDKGIITWKLISENDHQNNRFHEPSTQCSITNTRNYISQNHGESTLLRSSGVSRRETEHGETRSGLIYGLAAVADAGA